MLDQAGARIELRKFLLRGRDRHEPIIEHNGSGGGRSLIDGENEIRPARSLRGCGAASRSTQIISEDRWSNAAQVRLARAAGLSSRACAARIVPSCRAWPCQTDWPTRRACALPAPRAIPA